VQWCLAISRLIGPLESSADDNDENRVGGCERLDVWINTARDIQCLFSTREPPPERENTEFQAGALDIYVSYRSGRPSIQMRPPMARYALYYCAAQMIARGTTAHACDKCGALFVGGGERSKNKKRAGSRFCSDTCRYEYHNEARRKAARKAKL